MRFSDKFRNLLPIRSSLVGGEPVVYRPIGVVRNRIREPRTAGWENVSSDLFLREDLTDGLDGIEGFSHVIVIFHLDRIPPNETRVMKRALGDEIDGEIGLFATRLPLRPNAIGLGVVPVVWRRKNVLRVRGLDALDGSPVLDIKPYLPAYDSVAGARLPDWALKAMQGRR